MTGDHASSRRPSPRPPGPTCLVGVGASVEGVEALSALISGLAPDTGMAFLVVVRSVATSDHDGGRPPSSRGRLAAQLAAASRTPVSEATDGSPIAADHVYLLPPDRVVRVDRGVLRLDAPPPDRAHMPVDGLLRALAVERDGSAIAVVLAGSGSDGALGVQAIKAHGGIAFAQDPRSGGPPGMPSAAIGTGCVDRVIALGEIPAELRGAARGMRDHAPPPDERASVPLLEGDPDVKRILTIVQAAHEVDFSGYRQSTVTRRIQRRMVLGKVDTARAYLDLLHERPAEVTALCRDLLVTVTQFFRDPEVFDALHRLVFPKLLERRRERSPAGAPIRIWVPGCSTGEEVYSLAIALLEAAAERHVEAPFQIFGTDVSEEALEAARAGAYLENIAADVSPERLRRFFTRVGARYQISRAVRDACLFARHDITRDVPYSRLDLVSCRNVLIYLDPAAQRRIVPLFHYALVPGGGLVLGAAEALREGAELFSLLDKSGKLYVKSAAPIPPVPFEPVGVVPRSPAPPTDRPPDHAGAVLEAQREADRLVMSRYAPPGVLVGADLSIVQFRGRTGPYLDPAPGEASLDVLKMARVGLALELRNAIQKARRSGQPVRVERIGLRDGDQERKVAVEVVPLTVGEASDPSVNGRGPRSAAPGSAPETPARAVLAAPWLLVLFEEQGAGSPSDHPPARAARGAGAERKNEVERELAATKDYLRATIEEHEALSEELQSANEELISSNEELRSINDDLVAAKEELLAANAELTLLNQELAHRNAELRRRSDDLGTLLRSVEVPIVLLGNDLTLRHYTPQAERIMSLLPSDVGRPLGGVAPAFGVPELEQLAAEVLATGEARVREVRGRDGHAYSLRVRPCRAADGKNDGVVVVLIEAEGRAR